MLSLEFIRENPQIVEKNLQKRKVKVDLGKIQKEDQKRRRLINSLGKLQNEKNILSQEKISPVTREKGKKLKIQIKDKQKQLKEVEQELSTLLLSLPNILQEEVPEGEEGIVLRKFGEKPKFTFLPKSYLELNEKLNLIDTQRAAKVAGSRFAYLKGEMALLEFALIRFTLDFLQPKGFLPILPPVMIKPSIMESLGYGGLAQQDIYFLEKDNLNLIGTAEHSLAAMYQEEILDPSSLPQRLVGFSTCFRREAGSHGKDVKGIMREHQFDKLEMFSFSKPESSKEEQAFLLKNEEEMLQALGLHYQVVRLGSQDMAACSSMTIDIETWIPSEKRYRETHSCSNCTDYQARGLNIRYRTPDGKTDFLHTLNGTAFAIGRILIAILENYQQEDGSIKIPTALQKYLNFQEIKR
jgi:seryl-tRNA synthetase